jgi:hypothetical protein
VAVRAARFFLVQRYLPKTGEIYQITANNTYQIDVKIPNGSKIFQMAVKYSKWS